MRTPACPLGGVTGAGDNGDVDVGPLDRLLGRLRAPVAAGSEPGERPERRARGVYFTPAPLAEHVAKVVLEPLLTAPWRGGAPALRILDPAAGDGRFLAAA